MKLLARYLSDPGDDGNIVETLNWVNNSTKQGFEGVAEVTGYAVPRVSLGEPVRTFAHEALIAARATTEGLSQDNAFDAYRRRTLLTNYAYQERLACYGQHVADSYLDDAAMILGDRPRDIAEADEKLEAYVKTAAPEEDERLFTALYADTLRRCLLLAIPGSTYYTGLTEPVQPLT